MSLELSSELLNMSESATFAISDKAKKLKALGHDVINLGVGEPDFQTPDPIKNSAKEALDLNLTHYTAVAGTISIKEAIIRKLKRDNNLNYDVSQICVSNGAKQSIYNALKAIINLGDEVIVLTPTWVSYPEMIKICGATPVFVECKKENDFVPNIDDISNKITIKTKAIIINSPCNPTGAVFSRELLQQIADLAYKNNFYIISDEIYEKLIYDNLKHVSIASMGDAIKDRTIVINGVSKAYSMTGFRIGYAAGPQKIIFLMSKYQGQTTSCANSIAQYASTYAIDNGDESCSVMRSEFEKRRNDLCSMIKAIDGLDCNIPSGAFYLLVNIKGTYGKKYQGKVIGDSIQFSQLLLENEFVACVPGAPFYAPNHIRISYALSTDQLYESTARLKRFVSQLK